MAQPAQIKDQDELNEQLLKYWRDVELLASLALDGDVDEEYFKDRLTTLTFAAILLLFILAGGNPDTSAGENELNEQRKIATNSIALLATDVFDGRYSARAEAEPSRPIQDAGQGKEKLLNRLVLWTVTLAGVYHLGKIYGEATQRLEWRVGATEHCRDCLRMNGIVLTKEEWQRLKRLGLFPQSSDLECGGYRCQCGVYETGKPSIGIDRVIG